jgi:hypothetical protein
MSHFGDSWCNCLFTTAMPPQYDDGSSPAFLMFPEQDQTAFDWIRQGRNDGSRTINGGFVSHLIPPVFESYAKLLHTIGVHYEFIDNPLSPSENEILGIPSCEPLKSFVEHRRVDSQTRIRWKELADFLNVPFAPAISLAWYRKKVRDPWCLPRLLSGPNDGYLSQEERETLASALKAFTGNQVCFFRFSDIPFYTRSGQPQLFSGNLDEVSEFQKENHFTFEYWWPADRSWVVCSEYDLHYTIIGGRSELVSALLRDCVLECIEVNLQTRIDVFAPMP